jgi:histidinol-phosphate phosphatase family protein
MGNSANVAILAGGSGTRLIERSGGLPKPMVRIFGKPLLQYQIELCRKFSFNEIVLLVHYEHSIISDYFGDGKNFGISISYSIEESPRGTSGALHDSLHLLDNQFILLYGDTYFDLDLRKLWAAHLKSKADATLVLHPNDHPYDSDLVDLDSNHLVKYIFPYPHPGFVRVKNMVNAALYVLNKEGLDVVTPNTGKGDIAKQMFPSMLTLGRRLYGYITPEYIKDMGTPERLDSVIEDILKGIPDKLSERNYRAAVFLDRDGTINKELNYLSSADQLEILPGAGSAIRQLNKNGILTILVTNQPVVARGEISLEELNSIHGHLEWMLGNEGAFLNKIYFCPHHPHKGFDGEVSELKVVCSCRKPEPGLLNQACSEFKIDRRLSWMIGDTTSDIEAGRRAGLRTILLKTGYAGQDAKYKTHPDYVCNDLLEAVDWILKGYPTLMRQVLPVVCEIISGKRLLIIGGSSLSKKKFGAQIVSEILQNFGYKSHTISLDNWYELKLKPSNSYKIDHLNELELFYEDIIKAVNSENQIILKEPYFTRTNNSTSSVEVVEHIISSSDVIIVEGINALDIQLLKSTGKEIQLYFKDEIPFQFDRIL